jgi:hypothetical protein
MVETGKGYPTGYHANALPYHSMAPFSGYGLF